MRAQSDHSSVLSSRARAEYSVHALTWAIHNITESHDELVILRVIDPSSSSSTKLAMNEAAMEDAREEAEGVLADALKRARGEKSEDGVVGGGEALGGEKQVRRTGTVTPSLNHSHSTLTPFNSRRSQSSLNSPSVQLKRPFIGEGCGNILVPVLYTNPSLL